MSEESADQPSPFERVVVLEGSVNFRDVGGYPTADGRRVRWRTLFRSDGLSELTERDLVALGELGIATVVDLRSGPELELGKFPVERHPVDFFHFPFLDVLPDPETYRLSKGRLALQYIEMTHDAASQIQGAIALLAGAAEFPCIVHCTAGKDRTGVLIALVLNLLGVDDEAIVADYAISNDSMPRLLEKLVAKYPDSAEAIRDSGEMFWADPSNITGLLQALRDQYGSVEGYVESIGLGPDVVARLRDRLLED